MSIKIMALVWEKSQHKGSELLLMLAIADNANDQGIAYPSVRTLAKKTRLSTRAVGYLLRKLERSRELSYTIGTGPRGTNTYVIHIPPANFSEYGILPSAESGGLPPATAIADEPTTKPSISLTPNDLRRLGLTPGSAVWRALVDEKESPER